MNFNFFFQLLLCGGKLMPNFIFYIRPWQLAVYVSNKVPEVVVGDPGRFRQIITNLVGNSVKVSFSELLLVL